MAVDFTWRNFEMDGHFDNVEASEREMESAKDRLGRIQVPDPPLSAAERVALAASIREAGRISLPKVAETCAAVGAQWVAPWHRSARKSQDRYLEHCAAWEEHIAELRELQPSDAYPSNPAIATTWVRAKLAFKEAVRWTFLFSLNERNRELADDD